MKSLTINERVYDIKSVRTAPVGKLPFGAEKRSRNKRDTYFVNDFGCFDIETTSVITQKDQRGRFVNGYGFMYIWQFYSESTGLVMGHYWEEFIQLLRLIGEHYGCDKNAPRLVIYVHNLPFEAAFLMDQMTYARIRYEIFAVKNRKPVVIRPEGLPVEFRCSYKLTNRGLKKYLSDFKAAGFAKMSGDLDYRVQRTPKTVLSEQEMIYCAVDVIGLHAALRMDMQQTGDTVASIPLTSTGYVRRDYKDEVIKKDPEYKILCQRMKLDPEQFQMVLDLAKGGDTLGSASQELGFLFRKVGSQDFISSYPAQLTTEPYPYGKLEYEGEGDEIDLDYLLQLEREGRYYIVEFRVFDLEIREKMLPIPCINEWKCGYAEGTLVFNGRLLRAQEAGITLDMISFQLFRKQYKWSAMEFGRCYSCGYQLLPESVRSFILNYFTGKCRLKDVLTEMEETHREESEEYQSEKQDYNLYKNRLNGIFGMFYTKPVFLEHEYDQEKGEWKPEREIVLDEERAKIYYPDLTGEQRAELLEDMKLKLFKGQITSIGPYLWGVHTASLGRLKLAQLIEAAGYENVIYSDTDSIKFKINEKSLSGIERLRQDLTKKALDAGAVCDTGKNKYILGIPDDDGSYEEFVTLGAKRYAYRDKKGLHITVSGVEKSAVTQLKDDIKNFRNGFVFDPAGGIMLHYIEQSIHMQHVVGDDGTEDDIMLGNCICCEERIITLGGVPDDRFGLGFSVYRELLESNMSDDEM